jgi:hypothetical protein
MRSGAMYERFTDRARLVMQLANQYAHYMGYEYITTEHLLLALLQGEEGVATNALKNLKIDAEKLFQEIEKIVPRRPYGSRRQSLPQSPYLKQVLLDAIEEAELLDHNYVGTEHLLLSLVRQKESVAAKVLTNLGLALDDVRGEVLRLLGRPIPKEKASTNSPPPKVVPTSTDSKRIRSLERQLWNVRVILGAIVGAIAGVLLAASTGAVLGLILGGGVAALGRRIPAALIAGIAGVMLGSVHLPVEGGGVAGALLGALVGFLIAEIGRPSCRR